MTIGKIVLHKEITQQDFTTKNRPKNSPNLRAAAKPCMTSPAFGPV